MDFTGTIKAILPEQAGTNKGGYPWRLQQAVISDGSQNPKEIIVNQFNDDIFQQRLIVGRKVKVYLEPTLKVFKGVYYQQLKCTKVENIDTIQSVAPPPFDSHQVSK